MQAYPNSTAITVALEATPNESDSNSGLYWLDHIFEMTTTATVPSLMTCS
jgi:hypothetical protein